MRSIVTWIMTWIVDKWIRFTGVSTLEKIMNERIDAQNIRLESQIIALQQARAAIERQLKDATAIGIDWNPYGGRDEFGNGTVVVIISTIKGGQVRIIPAPAMCDFPKLQSFHEEVKHRFAYQSRTYLDAPMGFPDGLRHELNKK